MFFQLLMAGKGGRYTSVFEGYQEKAEFFMCSCLGKGTRNAQRTPGGIIFRQRWNNMQFVTSATHLMTVYSDYLTSAGKFLKCVSGYVSPSELFSFAKSQVLAYTNIIHHIHTHFHVKSMLGMRILIMVKVDSWTHFSSARISGVVFEDFRCPC